MPVTARLSKRFYDRFGDDIANELVNWFNDVDATYRSDLIRVNELNFARFDAKLEQRLAESNARMDVMFAAQEARWEKRFADFRAEIEKRFAEIDARFVRLEASLDSRFEKSRSEILKWMVGLWLTSMVAVGGMFFALLQVR